MKSRTQFAMAMAVAISLGWWTAAAQGQQVNIGGPFNSVGSSFYENIGTNWGLRGPGWFANFGGGAPGVAPQFGGFDPNAGANGGVGFRAGNVMGFLNFTAGQGANSTFVSQTPNVTITNGGTGYFIDGSFRPFVTSIIPVVGDNSDSSPLRERMRRLQSGEVQTPAPTDQTAEPANPAPAAGGGGSSSPRGSSAERGALSVAAIKAQAAAEQQAEDSEVAALLEKATGAEAAGKASVAKIYYQMAARRATGDRQREIQTRLEALK